MCITHHFGTTPWKGDGAHHMLVRYFDDMTRRSDDFIGGLFDDLFGTWRTSQSTQQVVPGTGLRGYRTSSDKDGMTLEVELPGVNPKEVTLEATDNQLVVQGSRGEKTFTNRYTISDDYDVTSATASMAHGLLTVKLRRAVRKNSIKIPITLG